MNPTFSLWTEPWIHVERRDGTLEWVSIQTALHDAHLIRRLYSRSPLVGAAIHRLLAAVVQDMVCPANNRELLALWRGDRFAADAIERFGAVHAVRFDLFSEDAPFLQSGDLPLKPKKRGDAKPAGYLFPEQPSGTAVTHYTHTYDGAGQLCARCAAQGLVMIPPFATSGGAGIKPSINGVPPIYVLPNLTTLYEQLVASLVQPAYQPAAAAVGSYQPWWRRLPLVEKQGEVTTVDYLASLMFPARRVRLHPELMLEPCFQCGAQTPWGVRTMIFEMGESRPKSAAFWQDPFAAYRASKKEGEPPIPVRPVKERALWREYAALFMKRAGSGQQYLRPRLLDQWDALWREDPTLGSIPVRTVGLRTDMKAKVFEWEEADFTLSLALLDNVEAAVVIEAAIEIATKADQTIRGVMRAHFGGATQDKRYRAVQERLGQHYWTTLEPHFRRFIHDFDDGQDADAHRAPWIQTVEDHALHTLRDALEQLASDAATLRRRVETEQHAVNALRKSLRPYREESHAT